MIGDTLGADTTGAILAGGILTVGIGAGVVTGAAVVVVVSGTVLSD